MIMTLKQLIEELINKEIEPLSYELSDDGVCPKDCLQCNNLTQCFVCRNGFYYIGVKEGEVGPIYCKNISNISIGYYKTIENLNTIYYPCTNGCDKCNNSGYYDRIGIFEVLNIDDDIKELIMYGRSSIEIRKIAMEKDYRPLVVDGVTKVLNGETNLNELNKKLIIFNNL